MKQEKQEKQQERPQMLTGQERIDSRAVPASKQCFT